MISSLSKLAAAFRSAIKRFRPDAAGQIAIIFAFASTALVVGVGSGIDLSRAYFARQKLSEVATLTCQYSTRVSVREQASTTSNTPNGFNNWINQVNAFANSSLANQNWNTGTTMGGATANNNYFTATPATGITTTTTGTDPTNLVTDIAADVPTMFLNMIHVSSIHVHARVACNTASTAMPGDTNLTPSGGSTGSPSGGNATGSTSFENAGAGYTFTLPSGANGTSPNPTTTFPASSGYTAETGVKWTITGYCLEVDSVGVISATDPDGTHSAELDCDNGSGSAGNSAISTRIPLQVGYYEFRYDYRSRVGYPNYDPAYICGSTAADVAWANDAGWGWYGTRTNQINVYLDLNSNGTAPLHTTLDGTQQLAGSNLIDECVYSTNWIERSIKVKITTPGDYWLSFAADGHNDSYGGQIDNIRWCQEVCTGSPANILDNFPSSWLAANNGGVNKVLFEDNFESPVYSQDPYTSSAHTKGGNLATSLGTTVVTTGCSGAPFTYSSPPGWPCQSATGWAVAPYNEAVYWRQGATQGIQYISLQGWNPSTTADISTYGYTHAGDPINRSISRKFLLDPGYYNVSYYYTSLMDFSYDFIYGTNCTAAPTYTNSYTFYGTKHGHDYGDPLTVYGQYQSTNILDVFMSNGQLVSTPNGSSTLGGAPTYTNPDGTTTSSPTAPLNSVDSGTNFATYSATAANPVIDTCIYSGGFAWVPRSVNIKITKPGWYWLSFSALGDPLTALGAGPGIDDVKLTALGSPFMLSPPTSALTTIPVPDPQPDSNYSNSNAFNGFYIVADPFKPTAQDQ